MFRSAVLSIAALVLVGGTALAQALAPPSDQDIAFEELRSGSILPLPDILARVGPTPGELLGSELHPGSRIYRLKYLRSGNVVWVDVDASSGRIIKQRGR